ncbi:Homeodomain-like protein, partial [Tribonema minus]
LGDAPQVETRNHVQCLQRWKKVLRPGLAKGPWTAEEDETLMNLVRQGDISNWGDVAAVITTRTCKQCRERWQHHLNPDLRRGDYSPEEDAAILAGYERHGNRWATIIQDVPGRTAPSIRSRY